MRHIRHQSYVSCSNIYTGTRLISIVLKSGCSLPRFVSIEGYNCRTWYRCQPLICKPCAVQGHKSANCLNKDKSRRCGASGHFACACPNPWEDNSPVGGVPPAGTSDSSVEPPVGSSVSPPPGSSAGLSAGSSANRIADPVGASDEVGIQALVHTEPAVVAGRAESNLEIGDFYSQSWDALEESSDSIGSFSESPSILRNADNSNVGEINIEGINTKVIDEGNINESDGIINNESNNQEKECSNNVNESNSKENEVLDLNSKSGEIDSNDKNGSVSEGCFMDLDASGPSFKRKSFGDDLLGRLLSRIPRLDPHKLIAKLKKLPNLVRQSICDYLWFCLVAQARNEFSPSCFFSWHRSSL